jgi:hypothetical protein
MKNVELRIQFPLSDKMADNWRAEIACENVLSSTLF